jgi:salicylate hydroxylase
LKLRLQAPARLASPLALSRQGHKIVVFDQFDEPRPLGSGLILQPTGPLWLAAGLGCWTAQVRALWPETQPLLDAIGKPDRMVLAGYGHHTLPLPYGNRIAFIGDSAHSTSPQLGQGANMALIDVAALSAALSAHRALTEALSAYAQLRQFHVRLYQLLSLIFTPFYQSDSTILPLARDWLVAPATRLPGVPKLLAKTVAGLLGDPLNLPEP